MFVNVYGWGPRSGVAADGIGYSRMVQDWLRLCATLPAAGLRRTR